jgi:hypothetical protein
MHDNLDDFGFNLDDTVVSLFTKYASVMQLTQEQTTQLMFMLKLD